VKLTRLELVILKALQGDMPLTSRPFASIAESAGATESEALEAAKALKDRNVLRRIGAILVHQRAGYEGNCMVVWRVEEYRIDEVGAGMAARKQISHCYSRARAQGWPYNLYTMIHAKTESECRQIVESLADEFNVTDYEMLFSREEYKKSSPVYVE